MKVINNYGHIDNLNKIWGKRFEDKPGHKITALGRNRFFRKGYASLTNCFPLNSKRILEIGFGSARFLAEWALRHPKGKAYGIEKSTLVIKQSRMRLKNQKKQIKNASLTKGDAFKVPFKKNSFDATFSEGLIEHYHPNKQEAMLREMIRVTKSGGKVVAGIPNYYCPSLILAMAYNRIDWRNVVSYQNRWRYGYEQPMKPCQAKALFKKAGLVDINIVSGWSIWYGLKFYKWDHSTQTPTYPWYRGILAVVQKVLEKSTDFIDPILYGRLTTWFGYEFAVCGTKP